MIADLHTPRLQKLANVLAAQIAVFGMSLSFRIGLFGVFPHDG